MRIPYYYPLYIKKLIKKYGVPMKLSKACYDLFSQMWNLVQLLEGKPTHYLGLGYRPNRKPRHQSVERNICRMFTIKNILYIQDGEEPGFIPNQGVQRSDFLSESEAEHEQDIFGKNIFQCKVQALAAKETTLKISEAKKIKETKEAPPELEDGGQANIDELIEVELGEEGDHRPTFVSALLYQ